MAFGQIIRGRVPLNGCLRQWNNHRACQSFSGMRHCVNIGSSPRQLCLLQEKVNPITVQSRSLCFSRTLHQEGPNNPLEPTPAKTKTSASGTFSKLGLALVAAGGVGWLLMNPQTERKGGKFPPPHQSKVEMVSEAAEPDSKPVALPPPKAGELTSASPSGSASTGSASSVGSAPPASTVPRSSVPSSKGSSGSTHSFKGSTASASPVLPKGQESAGDKDLTDKPCQMPCRRSVPKKYVQESSALKAVRGRCDVKTESDPCVFNKGANDPVTHSKPCMSSKN